MTSLEYYLVENACGFWAEVGILCRETGLSFIQDGDRIVFVGTSSHPLAAEVLSGSFQVETWERTELANIVASPTTIAEVIEPEKVPEAVTSTVSEPQNISEVAEPLATEPSTIVESVTPETEKKVGISEVHITY